MLSYNNRRAHSHTNRVTLLIGILTLSTLYSCTEIKQRSAVFDKGIQVNFCQQQQTLSEVERIKNIRTIEPDFAKVAQNNPAILTQLEQECEKLLQQRANMPQTDRWGRRTILAWVGGACVILVCGGLIIWKYCDTSDQSADLITRSDHLKYIDDLKDTNQARNYIRDLNSTLHTPICMRNEDYLIKVVQDQTIYWVQSLKNHKYNPFCWYPRSLANYTKNIFLKEAIKIEMDAMTSINHKTGQTRIKYFNKLSCEPSKLITILTGKDPYGCFNGLKLSDA